MSKINPYPAALHEAWCYAAPRENLRDAPRPDMQDGTLLAAVDLGSNSFRLEIGRYEHGHIQRIEYFKETVRQGAGLDEDKNLTPESMQRGWDCLARFAERLAGFPKEQVRAVATQTLREARNREDFIARGNQILGYPIDIVSGPEEARLIYQGVARLLPQSDERRLVVDIGGRSTELILGKQFTPSHVASFRVGSVAWSSRYFPQGQFTERAFESAEIAAKAVLDEALDVYQRKTWDVAYGSSGTVGAVGEVLLAAGGAEGRISRAGLDWLLEQLLTARSADRVRLPGLKDDRRAVIGGGISVLRAIFSLLGIEEMQVAQGALRQGALYDLLDREQPQTDLRSSTVRGLMQRFAVDELQAQRVAKLGERTLSGRRPCGQRARRAQARLGGTAARDWCAHFAQRISAPRRLHPRPHGRCRLRPARVAPPEPTGAGPSGQSTQAGGGSGRSAVRTATHVPAHRRRAVPCAP